MSYIGNPIVSTDFPVDYASGTGSQTAFTLSIAPASVNAVDVEVSGVSQSPQTYTLSGTTLTFSAAPPSGTNNIVFKHRGIAGSPNVPATASVTSASLAAQDLTINGLTVGKGASSDATSTVVGNGALAVNAAGYYNTAVGYQTLFKNTDGYLNNAFGRRALYNNTTGNENIAVGGGAMFSNTTGSKNIAIGSEALQANTTASYNTAVGYQAGYTNSGGEWFGTYLGYRAGYTSTGASNTFIGSSAGYLISTGSKNSILGSYNGNQGGLDIRTSSNYIVLSDGDGNPRGYCTNNGSWTFKGNGSASEVRGAVYAYTTNSGDLSYPAMSCTKTDNNQSTSQVYIQLTANGGALGNGQINGNGANAAAFGTYSDARLKENITDLPSQLNNIASLRPVEFDYIASEGGGHQIGFIAQEMQQIYPDAVNERADGMLTVTGWDKTTAMLVKAIQELNTKLESQAATIATQSAEIQALKGTV